MTLLHLCEPLFQYICNLRRSARAGASFTVERVRHDIDLTFQQIRQQAQQDSHLRSQFEAVELPLVFFVDFIVANEPALGFEDQWEYIAFKDYKEFAGDQQFFDYLDECLEQRGSDADERL